MNSFPNEGTLLSFDGRKLWHPISEHQSLQDSAPNQVIRSRQIIYYLPSAAGAVVVVVVVEGSTVLVAAGAAGAGVVTLVVVEVVASFSLLQPANNAKVTKPVAIIALVFIVVSYCFIFCLGVYPKNLSELQS